MATKRFKTQNTFNSESAQKHTDHPTTSYFLDVHSLSPDSGILLGYLPEEVWEIICVKHLNQKANQNLITSSSFFRNLLFGQRVLLLYTPVLELVFQRFKSETSPKSGPRIHFMKAYNIQKSFLLSNRQVCHTWKHGIDKLASQWTPKGREHDLNGLVRKQFSHKYIFQQSSELKNFLNKIQHTHNSCDNPFIGSYVCVFLDLYGRGPFVEYCNLMTRLLNKYGHHIKNCKIYVQSSGPCPAPVHSIIVDWLCDLPNLEALEISYNIHGVLSTPDFDQQLPKWKYLNHLVLQDLPGSLVNLILASSGRVTSLIVHRKQADYIDPKYLTELIYLRNLTFLEITMCTSSDYIFLKKIHSPLKSLCVYHTFVWDEPLDWGNMLQVISNRFCKRLQDVTLHFPDQYEIVNCEKAMEYSLTKRINLPNVKKLKVYMGNTFSMDFILGVRRNLEELIIVAPFPDWIYSPNDISKAKRNQIIQFVGYEERLLESNIWTIFPKLKTITVFRRDKSDLVFSRNNLLKS